MVRTVYADLLFLINFSMDFLCFFLVSRLFGRPLAVVRTIVASVLGGIYSVLSLFLPFHGVSLLLCDALACSVMCVIAEARRRMRPRRMLTEILVYTGVSMALGGVMTAAYTALNESGIPDTLVADEDGVSAWIFLLLAVIGGGATMLGSRYFRKSAAQRYYRVKVRLCERERTFRAAVDTGNALADPISGRPAAAVGIDALRGFLPQGICEGVRESPIGAFSTLPAEYRAHARLLPVETVTGEGMLLAFRADECYICPEGDRKSEAWEKRDVLIALTAATTTEAEMLLPPGIC